MQGIDFAPLGVANPDPGPGWQQVRWADLPLASGAACKVSSTRRASDGSPTRAGTTICSLRPKDHLINRRPDSGATVASKVTS